MIRELKGGILLPNRGYIQVHAYTSFARLPLEDAAVVITAQDGTVIAMRHTDRSGQIDPIPIPTPDIRYSLEPDPNQQPFTQVNLYARINGYEQIESKDLQVFSDRITDLNLEFIPLSEFPDRWDQTVIYDTPIQNL